MFTTQKKFSNGLYKSGFKNDISAQNKIKNSYFNNTKINIASVKWRNILFNQEGDQVRKMYEKLETFL